MPEGDTLHKIARSMAPRLEGRVLEELWLRDRGHVRELENSRVERIRAIGKHLLIELQGGWTVRVHLGLKGRVRAYVRSESQPSWPTARFSSGAVSFVCTKAYRAELVSPGRRLAHPKLRALGPDLLADEPGFDTMVRRATIAAHQHREISEVLLDQTIAAGIGNVYKSELLFLERLHPRTPLHQVDTSHLRRLLVRASDLMKRNLQTRRRITVPPHIRLEHRTLLWVYGRSRKPCLACGERIERIVQGSQARSTYFCPSCQRLK